MMIAAQVVGILAVASFLLSYQMKQRKHIVLVNGISSALYVLQYMMLGAFSGAALDVLSTIATFTAQNKEKKWIANHLKKVIIVINLSMVVAGLSLYQNIFSLFPILGAIFQTGAFWLSEERKIRLVSFVGAPFWLIYNISSCAYGSAIGSILCMISIGTAIYRYDILPKIKRSHLMN